MKHGLRHSVEEEADSHTGGEEHGEPAEGAEIGFRIITAQADVAVLAEHQIEDKEEDNVYGQSKKPPGICRDAVQQGSEDIAKGFIEEYGYDNKTDD